MEKNSVHVPAELSQMDIFARKIDFRPENNYFKNNMVKDLERFLSAILLKMGISASLKW